MRLNKTLQFAQSLAVKCLSYDLCPIATIELIQLSEASFRAGERECNTGNAEDKVHQKVKDKAKQMGLEVYWAGLYPSFRKDGKNICLPTL